MTAKADGGTKLLLCAGGSKRPSPAGSKPNPGASAPPVVGAGGTTLRLKLPMAPPPGGGGQGGGPADKRPRGP